jgi:hypothetical protein
LAPASGSGGGGGGAKRTSGGTKTGGAGFAGTIVITYTTPLADLLQDPFTTQNTARWSWGPQASIVNGQLNLVVANGNPGLIITPEVHDLTASSMAAQLNQTPNVGAGGTWTILLFSKDNTNTDYVGFVWQGGTLYFRNSVASTNSDTSVTYDPVTHKWMRLRYDGTSLYWETSSDGKTWTAQRTLSTGLPTYLNVGHPQILAGCLVSEATPGTAIWDNFNVFPPVGEIVSVPQAVKRASLW